MKKQANSWKEIRKMSTNKYPDFSVVMSVYKSDKADYFRQSIESIINQTVLPTEIILVLDGPVENEILTIINSKIELLKGKIKINVISLKDNVGLGRALNIAVSHCNCEWIARMDSDDISIPDRFKLQLEYIVKNPDVDVLGGGIVEFIDTLDKTVGYRNVPLDNAQIIAFMKKRCPFNHVTVFLNKKSLIRAGNYLHCPYNEDYYLWIRMALKKCRFANLREVLVMVRVGNDMYERRGGKDYFDSEIKIQQFMLKSNVIDNLQYYYNVVIRFIVQRVMPNNIRGIAFRVFARERCSKYSHRTML